VDISFCIDFIEDLEFFVLIISIDMRYLSTLLTRQNESDKLTQGGQRGGWWVVGL
jgi:hypothetical protein